jgi:hypothetical protein
MSTSMLVHAIQLEIWAFAIGLLAAVIYRLATGRINLRGLLRDKRPPPGGLERGEFGRVSPTRVQLLMLTVAGAFGYLALVPTAGPGTLPDVPRELLYLFGGSASIYLGGKGTPLVIAGLFESKTNKDREEKEK